jgi:hypothetical protein
MNRPQKTLLLSCIVGLLGWGASSVYSAMAVQNALSAVKVMPNPWRADRHPQQTVTFANLPTDSMIKIFTVSGHLVKTLGPATTTQPWDLTNSSGDKVASGIYIYLVTVGGEKTTGKLVLIK